MISLLSKGKKFPCITSERAPGNTTPLLLTFPHSGEYYPDDFSPNSALPYEIIDFPNDKYVDELYDLRTSFGLPFVKANFPRVYIDVNRHQHDIDPKMMESKESWYGRLLPTTGGLETGTSLFWSKTKSGIYDLYDRKLSQEEMKRRLAKCYIPFHQAVAVGIEDIKQKFNETYVMDCHSYAEFDSKLRGGGQRPQIDIANRNGQSCSNEFTECVANAFSECGYDVTINGRYIGGEMLLRYGWPQIGQHALQIEIRRDLYMDEESRKKTGRFLKMQQDCSRVLEAVVAYVNQR